MLRVLESSIRACIFNLDKIYLTKLTNLPLNIDLSLLTSNLFDSYYSRPNYSVRYLPCYHRGLSKLLFGCCLVVVWLLFGVGVVLLLLFLLTAVTRLSAAAFSALTSAAMSFSFFSTTAISDFVTALSWRWRLRM
jgi:hypothetical protein